VIAKVAGPLLSRVTWTLLKLLVLALTAVSTVLQPPTTLLQSSVTVETRLTSVYNTHIPLPGRTHFQSLS